jgi:hypothetical protein
MMLEHRGLLIGVALSADCGRAASGGDDGLNALWIKLFLFSKKPESA